MVRSPSLASAILSGDPQDGPHRLRTGTGGKGAMPRVAWLVVSLVLALGTVAWTGPAAVVTAQESGYAPDGEEWAFVDLVNAYRASIGVGPVTMNYELGAAADYHSYDMAANNYFDHYSLSGVDPGTNIQNFGYTGFPYAENIAAGMATAQEVLIGWQNSPDHDATMRNPEFTEIGVGRHYGEGSHYGWYWTATYGGGEGPQSAPETVAAPVEVSETLPAPVVAPETTTVVTDSSGMTNTVIEPPTVITNDGGAIELEQPAVNADGDRAVSTGLNPVADGTGETIIYGDINTGGVTGETVIYEPPSLSVSGETAAPAPAPIAAPPAETTSTTTTTTTTTAPPPSYTDQTFTETTTTNISMDDGNGRAIGGP
jgi:uncharacterized protein YkwD